MSRDPVQSFLNWISKCAENRTYQQQLEWNKADEEEAMAIPFDNPQDPENAHLAFRASSSSSSRNHHSNNHNPYNRPIEVALPKSKRRRKKPSRTAMYWRNRVMHSNNNNSSKSYRMLSNYSINLTRVAAGMIMAVLAIHRSLSIYMSNRSWINAPITYMNRACPAPAYATIAEQQRQQQERQGVKAASASTPIPSNRICITTLTDSKSTSWYQRFIRWRNFDGILELTHSNKARYAEKHGYRLVDGSDWIDVTRPPAWSKIPAVQHLLKSSGDISNHNNINNNECEWVMWTDADTVIMNSERRLEEILPVDSSSYDLIVGSDNGGGYNSGVFVVRNSPWGRQFMDRWWNMTDYVRPPGFSLSGDNAAMKALLRDMPAAEFAEHVLSPARCTLNSFAKFLTVTESASIMDGGLLDRQEWYLSENYYHKGDFIAHTPGYDNKANCLRMLLAEAR